MEKYTVKQLHNQKDIVVTVPGSKSITNRALLLAALSQGKCTISGVLFSDDSRAFLSCLESLGFSLSVDEAKKEVTIQGTGGVIPNKKAQINVRSAGTAARFLTVMLAFAGGEYTLQSSEQMEKRPMQPLLSELRAAGVEITCLKNEGCFPFILRSNGVDIKEITIDTEISSQFASALLMSATLCKKGLTVKLTGNRTEGAYIAITAKMLSQFGIRYEKAGAEYYILPQQSYSLTSYDIEPDFSAACYFFAAGALLNKKATVKGLRLSSMQGDKKFLSVLQNMGCTVLESQEGVTLTGAKTLRGVSVNMNDFSDQALTLAAIAPFASSPTQITGVAHIRKQECDRIHAMAVNLKAMGVKVEEKEDGITVYPCNQILPAQIQTFSDHRVAMSFSIAGLKCGCLTIQNPKCCQKTFENFFEVLEGLYLYSKEEDV
ncbi:MAG: 3-phosphoshikimate 1-carboxyvinyltransferase [Clostridia bacterium]|nr:3-phosphoshikimate 1-carboxyvinyltransferase [Clostridia bacterium]